jgi:hypothetical protein
MTDFWDVALYSLIEVDRRFTGVHCLHHQGALRMEAVRACETSVYCNDFTWRFIPEGYHLNIRGRESLKSHIDKLFQQDVHIEFSLVHTRKLYTRADLAEETDAT